MQPRPFTFTTYGQGLLDVLKNKVGFTASGTAEKIKLFQAVWDTGATGTVVTERVVAECGLEQTGMTKLQGIHGSADTPTYLVDIFLPNRVVVRDVTVASAPLTEDADVLVGMNIIAMGDFAVSSYGGKTSFSFRIPSMERIDFLPPENRLKAEPQIRNVPKVGRNAPCPCESGKKFKKCCGN